MLGVIDDKLAVVFYIANRVADHRQVLFRRRPQDFLHVQQPRLADDGHDGRSGFEQQPHLRVVLDGHAFASRRAKRREPGALEFFASGLREKFDVFGIAPGPAAFDVMNSKGVDAFGNAELVRDREIDALALAAVTQGRIVDFHVRFRHRCRGAAV